MKPGYKTTEFWLTFLAWVATFFLASGVVPDTSAWVKIAAFVSTALAQLGYTTGRTSQKLASGAAQAALKAKEMDL